MKKVLKRALLVVLALVLGFVALVGFEVWRSFTPTKGPRIGTYDLPAAALLVVDIQEDYTGPNAKKRYRDAERLITAANQAIDWAHKVGTKVVFIRNEVNPSDRLKAWSMGYVNLRGAPGTEMDARLLKPEGARTFPKEASDAFSNPELYAYLRSEQVASLFVVGLDAAYCVNATTRGALNRGYRVTVFSDAIATESGKSLEEIQRGYVEAGATVTPVARMD